MKSEKTPEKMPDEKPELLAPAGGFEQLEYALHYGADAVYIGGEQFGLRKRADNFTDADIPRAVELAHAAGKRVYVTCNAMMHEADLAPFADFVRLLAKAQVDAVIASDLGTLATVREHAPNVAIHVSTQASVTNHAAARQWYELGARRIVVARELSLEEIALMREQLPEDLELEVFVHGAMCMAYSGRCLISNFLTGRDANKGHCTQSCRWTYTLEEEKRPGVHIPIEQNEAGSFIMSATDLCMLDHLDDLKRAGVDSIKIEGRVKGAYYVATVVNAYRKVLDGADPALFADELNAVSHRPYDTGFFFGPATQATDGAEYLQDCILVGTVVDSHPEGDAWRSTISLRNRFNADDELELLAASGPVTRFTARDLLDEDGHAVKLANNTLHNYSFITPTEFHSHDLIRKRG